MAARASYRRAVDWIALNDEAGSAEAHSITCVCVTTTVALVAALYGEPRVKVAHDVVTRRARLLPRTADALREGRE